MIKGSTAMSFASEQYRHLAGNCLRRASQESDPGKRAIYVTIAQACITLADRNERALLRELQTKRTTLRLH
jgi:hypothetical protein